MYGFADYAALLHRAGPAGDLDRHAAVLANIEFHAGRPWPLDLALWDLAGKIRRPARLAHARRHVATVARLRVERCSPAGRGDGRDGTHAVDAGFEALKIRFGRPSVDDDISVVARDPRRGRRCVDVDGRLQPGVAHAVGHGARRGTSTMATDVAAQLEAAGRVLDRGAAAPRRLRRLCRAAPSGSVCKIAGGEMTREPYEFRELLRARLPRRVPARLRVLAGHHRPRAAGRARSVAAGKLFTPHTWGNGIGVLANMHLTAGTVGCRRLAVARVPVRPAGVVARSSRLSPRVTDRGAKPAGSP